MSNADSPFMTPEAPLDDAVAQTGSPTTRTSMSYMDAYLGFFRSPKWGMNLLLLAVCILIPIVGIMVVQGYMIAVFVDQHRRSSPYAFEFNFNRFGDFLGFGVWPFLASLVLGLLVVPVVGAGTAVFALSSVSGGEPSAIAAIVFAFFFFVVLIFFAFLSVPVLIRAALTQSVGSALSLTFARSFLPKMWVEVLLSQLFLGATALPLFVLGYLTCGIGLYPAIVLMTHAQFQLQRQMYEVFLSREGSPIEFSPKFDQMT